MCLGKVWTGVDTVVCSSTSETGHMRDDFGNLIDFVQKLHRMKVWTLNLKVCYAV